MVSIFVFIGLQYLTATFLHILTFAFTFAFVFPELLQLRHCENFELNSFFFSFIGVITVISTWIVIASS